MPKTNEIICKDNARFIIDILNDLAKQAAHQKFRSAIREAKTKIKYLAFGYSKKYIEKQILSELFEYDLLSTENLTELTKIPGKELLPVLKSLKKEKILEKRHQRRWQEPGKHYFDLWKMVDEIDS